jgi:hypothetical protein
VWSLAETARWRHPLEQLQSSARSLIAAAQAPAHGAPWGWKEPNTHIVIERLWQRLPGLRYVHVVRNGLDMAVSDNQNQLEVWGPSVLGSAGPATPARSLRYWCAVHQRMQRLQAAHPERVYWLNYDAFCREPDRHLPPLLAFLGQSVPAHDDLISALQLAPPAPKYTPEHLREFAPADVEYVYSLGYA